MDSVSKIWHSHGADTTTAAPSPARLPPANTEAFSPWGGGGPSPSPTAPYQNPPPAMQNPPSSQSTSVMPTWAEAPVVRTKVQAPSVYSESYVRHLQSIVDQTRRHSGEIERSVTDLARQLEDKQRECDELRRAVSQDTAPIKSAMQKEHRERVRLEDEVSKLRNVVESLEKERDRVEQERDIFRERFTVLSRVPLQHQRRSDAVGTFFDKYVQSAKNPEAPPSSWKVSNAGSVRREELLRYLEMLDREHVIVLSREGVFDFVRVLCHRMILRAAARERGNLCATASQLVVDKKSGMVLAHEGLEPPPSLEGLVITRPTIEDSGAMMSSRQRTPSPPLATEKNIVRLYNQRMASIAADRLSATEAHSVMEHIKNELDKTAGDEAQCCELLHEFLKYVGLTHEPIRDFHLDSNPRVFLEFLMGGDRVGRIEIELFKSICPKTCKNFQAWCCGTHTFKDGTPMSYKGTKLHGLMPGFAFFAGSGDSLSSIFGKPFASESYEVLPDQPGRVMTDNCGNPENNTSMFCISAMAWPDEYAYRGVCFGQVVRNLELVVSIAEQPVQDGSFLPEQDIVISNCGLISA